MKAKILLAAALAISMAACTQDDNTAAPAGKPVTITAGINQKADTRVDFNVGETSTQVLWEEYDMFSIHNPNIAEDYYLFVIDNATAGSTTGTFSCDNLDGVIVPNGDIYAVSMGKTGVKSSNSLRAITFSNQNGTAADCHLMVATIDNSTNYEPNWEDLDFNFENKTAVLQITLSNPAFAGQTVSNIKVSAPGLVGYGTYTFATGEWTNVATNATINANDQDVPADQESFILRIAQPPLNEATGPITVTATAGGTNYTATLKSGKFGAAKMYQATATMTEADKTMAFTIKTTADDQTFTLPFYDSTGDYTLTVYWGEGTPKTIPAGTAPNHATTKHTYATAGTYTITLTSTAPSDDAQMPRWIYVTILKSMDTPMLKMLGTDLVDCFYDCTSLETIHPQLFAKNTHIENFSSCFEKCTALTEIPNGLFHGMTAVTNFYKSFYNCTHAKANPYIFWPENSDADAAFGTRSMDFDFCFNNVGSKLGEGNAGIAPELWKYKAGSASKSGCFGGCSSMTNYADIPNAWGGPAQKPTLQARNR